jgi:hypothetical protein
MIRQLVDFAHARTSVARQGMRVPFVGPVPKSAVHPDTAGSDVFERFEQLCVEAAEINAERAFLDALNKNPLRVTTQFDARVHRGTQRGKHGPKSYVDQSKPRKNGPLRTLFMAYASRDDHRRRDRDASVFFSRDESAAAAAAAAAGSLLSRAEVFGMMRDFDVVPSLLHERDVRLAFAHADAPAVGTAAAANRENELDFHEFCRFLANVATLLSAETLPIKTARNALGVDSFDPNEMITREMVTQSALRLLRRLECDSRDTRRLRAKVDEAFRFADRNPRAEGDEKKNVLRKTKPRAFISKTSALTQKKIQEASRVVVSMKGVSLDDPRFTADKACFVDAFRVLTKRENPDKDEPAWTLFPFPAVDCGTLFPGDTRRFRVRVANENPFRSVAVRVRTEGVPCVEARFKETKTLAPGLTETVQLVAGADAAGEWLGAVVVEGVLSPERDCSETLPMKEKEKATTKEKVRVVVPVYLNVVHRDREIVVRAGDALGMRGFERQNGVAGVAEPGRERAFGFTRELPPREADAAERLRMREPAFVSKRIMTSGTNDVTLDARRVASSRRSALVAADAFVSAASARDVGWWGEKSEERVFHEMANMREIALDKRMKTKPTETKNGRFTRDASGERETEGDATTTAFRLSKRGLRY